MPKNNRTVSRRPDGSWANKLDGNQRASSLHKTQAQAVDVARTQLKSTDGGELKIKGKNNLIRAKNTIAPAKDPFPPRG